MSRDIGVRFTWRTWNLTTHRIDPNVDEARDYVVEDLFQAERIDIAGYVDGVGACDHRFARQSDGRSVLHRRQTRRSAGIKSLHRTEIRGVVLRTSDWQLRNLM